MFCENCGTRIPDGGVFCPNCGHRNMTAASHTNHQTSANNPSQQNITTNRPNAVRQPYVRSDNQQPMPNRYQSPVSQRHSKKSIFLSVALSVILVVEGVIAGVWYPGFFNPQKEENNGDNIRHTDNNSNTINTVTDDDFDIENLLAAYAEPLKDTENIALRYSEQDVNDATPLTAKVSSDNPIAQIGEVKVDFQSWNLENENDELVVRELKELSEGDDGWTIKAYDFKLTSGQSEFATNVEITIPCDNTDSEVYSCVGFNEESGKWEDLYGKCSDDGKSYTIYTNHFSKKGLKKLKYVYDAASGTVKKREDVADTSKLIDTIDLDAGVIKERPVKKGQTRMQTSVVIDYTLLWNMFDSKTLTDVQNIAETMKYFESEDFVSLSNKNISDTETASTIVGVGGAADNLNTLLKNVGYTSPFVGKALIGADIALVMLKIQAEAMKGNNTYWESLKKSFSKHKGDLAIAAGSATASLLTASSYGGWAGALVGLVIWGGVTGYKMIVPETTWKNTKTPKWEDLYQNFYYSGYKVDCGSESAKSNNSSGNYNYAVMTKPKSMTAEKWKEFSKTVNENPLSITYNSRTQSYKYKNFAEAYTKLIELYKDDIFTLEQVIEEFHRNYAKAFWNLPEKSMYNYVYKVCKSRGAADYFEDEYYYESPVKGDSLFFLDNTDPNEKADMADMEDELISVLYGSTSEQLEAAFETYMLQQFTKVEKDMTKLQALLNTKLIFHVNDTSLLPNQTFKDSLYCRNWKTIKENKDYLPKNREDDVTYDYRSSDFITPMRFVMSEPLFKPLDSKLKPISYTEYYPHRPDFIPQAKKNQKDNVVYTCTLYHYLMMGAPKQMEFKDVSDPKTYADQEPVMGDIVFPKITEDTAVADVQINVEGRNDIKELEGMWGAPAEGSEYENKTHKQITLIVQDEGKNNSFTSTFTEKEMSFTEGGSTENAKFVFIKEPQNNYGILTMWHKNVYEEEPLVLTLEYIKDNIIRIKEYNYYLENKDIPIGAQKVYMANVFSTGGVNINTNKAQGYLETKADGTAVITLPKISYTKEGNKEHAYHHDYFYSMSAIKIKAELSGEADRIDYENGGSLAKVYYVTECTDPIEVVHKDTYVKKETSETKTKSFTLKNVKKYSKQKSPAELQLSQVLLYYDQSNSKKLVKAAVMLSGENGGITAELTVR